MKYQKALLCITLAGTLIFSGCGSTNNSTGKNTNTTVVPQQATGTLTTTIQQRHLANLTLMAQIPPKPLAIRLVETTILPLPTTAVPRI